MDKKIAAWAVTIAALACAGVVRAHHSISMIDISTPIWVKGTVVRYQPVHPHALVTLDERRQNGQVHRWIVEGPNLNRLKRMGVGDDFLKDGDVIEICGFAFKEEILKARLSRDSDGSSLPALHGHVLVMPDGHRRLFGPYGKLDNCIRQDDSAQLWLDLLREDALARDAWCSRNLYRSQSIASKQFVDEITRLMAIPCD